MPELPEVENLTRQLKSTIESHIIINVKILFGKLRSIIPINLANKTIGAKIINLRRRAKYIILNLDNDYSIVIHLGMTGRVNIQRGFYEIQKHDHLIMTLSNDMTLIYNDPRRFGLIELIKTNDLELHRLFAHLAIEPLEDNFNASYLLNKIKNKASSIKNAIMDNRIIVGVGNIYASEALFVSHIRPDRIASSIKPKEAELLVKAIKEILQKAIKAGGSSIRDFVNIDNQKGGFQNLFSVYGRASLPCYGCGSIIQKIIQSGRSSFFCPSCQK